jgi:teichuronic acid biosynthesis glycosyltransferase TuaG
MSDDKRLVSIVTPVYNAAKYIEDTANSIFAQSYVNWEWLVVDDCSKDDSYTILKNMAQSDKRIRLLQSMINSGAFAARNIALQEAKGQFIAFLDADDLWTPDKLERQMAFMVTHNYNFTYTAFRRFKESINEYGIKTIMVPETATYNRIISNNYIATSTVVVNVEQTGDFRMKDVYYDDFVLWLDLLKRVPIAKGLNEPLMYYRLSPNSLSRNKFKSAIKVYYIFKDSLQLSYFNSRFLFVKWIFHTTKRYLLPGK